MTTTTVLDYGSVVNDDHQHKMLRATVSLALVLAVGTGGFMILQEDWGFWKSLYFTVITITTVGYGDYGLSPAGERFTTILLLGGIAAVTYSFGQFVQAVVGYHFAWRLRMQQQVDKLSCHYIVCGAGRVGRAVCDRLADKGMPFVIVEKDPERYNRAIAQGHMAVHGSATDDETLIKAGIERAGGIVCAASADGENLVITLSARELNPDIPIVSRGGEEDSVRKFKRAGASHVVSPAANGGKDIANLLLHPHLSEFLLDSHGSNAGYVLDDVSIEPKSALVGMTLREYGGKERSVVFVAIKHADGTTRVRPTAQEAFQPGDIVIVAGEADAVRRMAEHAMGNGRR